MVLVIYSIYKVTTFMGLPSCFSLTVAQAIILTVLACSFYRLARSLTGDARLARWR